MANDNLDAEKRRALTFAFRQTGRRALRRPLSFVASMSAALFRTQKGTQSAIFHSCVRMLFAHTKRTLVSRAADLTVDISPFRGASAACRQRSVGNAYKWERAHRAHTFKIKTLLNRHTPCLDTAISRRASASRRAKT